MDVIEGDRVIEGMERAEKEGLRCGMRGLSGIGADLPKG